MPVPALKTFSTEYNIPMSTLEQWWDKHKKDLKKQYSEDDEAFNPVLMKIIRNKAKAHSRLNETFLNL